MSKGLVDLADRPWLAPRCVIRHGLNDDDRALLADMLGVDLDEASPVLPPGHVPAARPLSTVALTSPDPVVAKRAAPAGDRLCPRCEETKPATKFYATRKLCKRCHQKTNSEAQARRKEARRAAAGPRPAKPAGRPRKPRPDVPPKTCSRCKETKPPSDFHLDAKAPGGLRPECIDCGYLRRRAAA